MRLLTLIDVIVTNKDHLAQILNINVNRPDRRPVKSRKRQFTKESINEFNYLLQKASWQKSLSNYDINTSFNALMDTILYHYNTTFSLKTVCNIRKNKWLT
jgi:hypothetical protein